jgi:glycosyltransferase involved in cell wall biosynthesis
MHLTSQSLRLAAQFPPSPHSLFRFTALSRVPTAPRRPHIHAALRTETGGIDGTGGSGGPGGSGGGGGGDDGSSGDGAPWHGPRLLLAALALGTGLHIATDTPRQVLPTATVPVSIIVPALNEAKTIDETVTYLLHSLDPPPAHVIVVDGGSTDGTPALARRAGARVVRSPRGRGRQQNAGAAVAPRDDAILMFVHADSRPPKDAVSRIRLTLADPRIVLGGFFTSIETSGRPLLFTTLHNFASTYYAPILFSPSGWARGLKCMFGDQSLFCRAADFRRVGGFDNRLPIMEDADLCVRMHKSGLRNGKPGREVQLVWGAPNRTSGRRIGAWGNVRATAIQYRIAWAWWRGASPEELWDLYDRLYTDAFR